MIKGERCAYVVFSSADNEYGWLGEFQTQDHYKAYIAQKTPLLEELGAEVAEMPKTHKFVGVYAQCTAPLLLKVFVGGMHEFATGPVVLEPREQPASKKQRVSE
jgi:hypothetical protein